MKLRRFFSLLLSAALLFSLGACTPAGEGEASTPPVQSPSEPPVQSPGPTPDHSPGPSDSPALSPSPSEPALPDSVRLTFLNGPTGVGAAKLLTDIDAGTAQGRYTYEVAADNSEVVGMLTAGETDIAALATNVALNLYNKTDGGIRLLALNTLGVLYVLERDGTAIEEMADLEGRTVYATGQGANPEFVLNYLLEQSGLDPDRDVNMEWLTAEEVSQAFLSGAADTVLLPVPAVTALMAKCAAQDIPCRIALDLTEQWEALGTGSTLTMGCVAVRTAFAQERPEDVARFLAEYAASIDYVKAEPEKAASMVADHGLAPSAAIAQRAIPDCHLVCVTGASIQPLIDGYYTVLFQADPASIGGSLPDDGFYYVP